MANWCNNEVVFNGDPYQLDIVIKFFKRLLQSSDQSQRHWLPPFIIDLELIDDKVLYRSRWVPNNQAIAQLAEEYRVNFVNRYDEMGMGIIGEASTYDDYYFDVRLDAADFQTYHYDEGKKLYVFQGQTYKFEWTIFELMLEQKKAGERNFKSTSDIKMSQLTELYGELLPGDLIVKFAEHKNFKDARKVFLELEKSTINQIEEYVYDRTHIKELYETENQYMAFSFLRYLLTERHIHEREKTSSNGLTL